MPKSRKLPISVFAVDDHDIVLQGIRQALADCDDIILLGESYGGEEAVRKILRIRPDVVVLDVLMPKLTGFELLKLIKEEWAAAKVLMYTAFCSRPFLAEAVALGADGYLVKDGSVKRLKEAIRAVAKGKKVLDYQPTLDHSVVRLTARSGVSMDDRRIFILKMAAAGATDKEIGVKVGLNHRTVEYHRQLGMRALGVNNKADLVKYAVENGWIEER